MLLGLAIPLGALEAYLRLTGVGGGFYEPDPVLGARHIPNRSGRWRKACFDVPIRINSDGLRDVEHQREKLPETVRIAVLGDSLAEALQVPLEQSFPRRLEAMLNASGQNPRAEVINFGVSGYGTDQEYLTLKTHAATYRPDVVVLAFTIGNDVRNNSPALERQVSSYAKPFFRLDAEGRLVAVPFEASRPSTAGVLGTIKAGLRYFRLYDFLVDWAHSNPSALAFLVRAGLIYGVPAPGPGVEARGGAEAVRLDYEVYLKEPDAAWAEAWRVTEALVRGANRETKRMGGRFVLVPIPSGIELAPAEAVAKVFPGSTPERYDLAGPRRRLERIAETEGFDYVSVYDVFLRDLGGRHGKLEDLFFWCDGHLTPQGHQLVAEAIAAHIRRPARAPAPHGS